jgi:hypothetical protein
MGEEGEVVTLGYQRITVNPAVAVIIQICQYPPVSPKLGMDIPYIIILIAIETVVVIVTALVGTKFLIRPSKEPGSAVKTYSFHSRMFC